MKRIILFLMLACIGISAQAQTPVTLTALTAAGVAKSRDTTTNADTTYLTVSGGITAYGNLLFDITNTQLSGTSGGSIIFQGSASGIFGSAGNWKTLVNDKTQAIITDTATVSGTTNTNFVIKTHPYRYIRVRYISSGTQTSVMTGTVTYFKPTAIITAP